MPAPEEFEGIEVLQCPFEDTQFVGHCGLTDEEQSLIEATARAVAARLKAGKAVLVTCYGGYNRSGLVTAKALHYFTEASGRECVSWIRKLRQNALHNPKFVELLYHLEGKTSKPLEVLEFDLWTPKPLK